VDVHWRETVDPEPEIARGADDDKREDDHRSKIGWRKLMSASFCINQILKVLAHRVLYETQRTDGGL
jgi:hypothetical protein